VGKLDAPHPVVVADERRQELLASDVPEFNRFVVSTGDDLKPGVRRNRRLLTSEPCCCQGKRLRFGWRRCEP
jgi:hypothetical protein